MRRFAALLSIVALPGCATMMEGTGQSVSVATTPAGATCEMDQAGTKLGTINPTPGSLRIDKSKNDLDVTCSKPGYLQARTTTSPKFVGTTFGNIVAGGLIGFAVDAATGASYEYPSDIKVELAPVPPATATGPVSPLDGKPAV
jgi:hypothetical protein